jgi:hypothetical protein
MVAWADTVGEGTRTAAEEDPGASESLGGHHAVDNLRKSKTHIYKGESNASIGFQGEATDKRVTRQTTRCLPSKLSARLTVMSKKIII